MGKGTEPKAPLAACRGFSKAQGWVVGVAGIPRRASEFWRIQLRGIQRRTGRPSYLMAPAGSRKR
jgi:hypothetical protein